MFHFVEHGMDKAYRFPESGDAITEPVRLWQSLVRRPLVRPGSASPSHLAAPSSYLCFVSIVHSTLLAQLGGVKTVTFAAVTGATLM